MVYTHISSQTINPNDFFDHITIYIRWTFNLPLKVILKHEKLKWNTKGQIYMKVSLDIHGSLRMNVFELSRCQKHFQLLKVSRAFLSCCHHRATMSTTQSHNLIAEFLTTSSQEDKPFLIKCVRMLFIVLYQFS